MVRIMALAVIGCLASWTGAAAQSPDDFTPIDQRATLTNGEEVAELIRQGVAELDGAPGLPVLMVGGPDTGSTIEARDVVHLWVFVDAAGEVVRARLDQRSESSPFGPAVLAAASGMRFEPAAYRGKDVTAWHRMTLLVR